MTRRAEPLTLENTRWVLKQHPEGPLNITTDVELVRGDAFTCTDAECGAETVVVAVDMLSVDAFLRTMLDAPKTKTDDDKPYHGSLAPGDTVPAIGYGHVVWCGAGVSAWRRHTFLRIGASVAGLLGAQTFARVPASSLTPRLVLPGLAPTTSLGLLGLTSGFTAWTGVHAVTSRPCVGETVVVSAATGAVGSIAAQLATRTGARVVGVAGGAVKTAFLRDTLGLDDTVDYKSATSSVAAQLDTACPDGIDFFFDNVGGELLDAVLCRLNFGARVVICGAVSQYNTDALARGAVRGPREYLKLAERGASMHGFVVTQYCLKPWTFLRALADLTYAHVMGQVTVTETVHVGLQAFPEALSKLFTGQALGKMLVDVSATATEAKMATVGTFAPAH